MHPSVEGQCKFNIFILIFGNVKLRSFQRCMLKSLGISSQLDFFFANLSVSSPVDFNSNSNLSKNSPVISVCVSASQKERVGETLLCFECPRQSAQLTLHLLSQPQRPFRYEKCQRLFSWLLNSKLPLTCIELVVHVFFFFTPRRERW